MGTAYWLTEIQVGFAPGYSFEVKDVDGRCEYVAVEHLNYLQGADENGMPRPSSSGQ